MVDNFSNSTRSSTPSEVEVIEGDLTQQSTVETAVTPDVDLVIHLAARKDPNDNDPAGQFMDNTTVTHLLLDRCRSAGIDRFAFASSSYGVRRSPRPTPEEYAPLESISEYGVSKLGEEGLVTTYAHSYGFSAHIFRFANIVGPMPRGAVIPDYIEKLRDDPNRLRILGDSRQ